MTRKQYDAWMKVAIAAGIVTTAALVAWWSIVVKDVKEWHSFPKGEKIKYDTVRVLSIQYNPELEKNTYYIMDDEKQDKIYSMRAASDRLCPFVEPLDSAVVKTTKRAGGFLDRKIVENLTKGRKMKEFQLKR